MQATKMKDAQASSQPGRDADAEHTGVDQSQHLTFVLDGVLFAMPILAIKEIIEYGGVTPVPMMPDWVRGVMNLRGAVVPVVDLAARFGHPSSPVTKRTCIVIVEVEREGEAQDIGVIVDAVNQVVDIPSSEIEPPPTLGARIRSEFIEGMGKVEGKFAILLDVDAILAIEAMEFAGARPTDATQGLG